MTYKVTADIVLETPSGVKTLKCGQVIKMSALSAAPLIEAKKIEPVFEPMDDLKERMCIMGENTEPGQTEPYVTDSGILVIPWNSSKKYHYWNGGQSVCDTLKQLGRCDLIEKYKSFYSN